LVDSISQACVEYHLKGSYGGNIPLDHIVRLFRSAMIEIDRLQKENDNYKMRINQLEVIHNVKKKEDVITDAT